MDDKGLQTSDENQEPVQQADQDQAYSAPLLTWQASEYLHHDKSAVWYTAFFVVVAGLAVAGALTKSWTGLVLLAVMAIAVLVWTNKPPRVLQYTLSDSGVTIESHFYPYSQFRSFSSMTDQTMHFLDLEPTQRFMPRLTLLLDDDNVEQVIEALSAHLPRVDRTPDLIDRLSRIIRF